MIDGFGDANQFNRALALMVGRLARTDAKAAEELLDDFRPSNDFSVCDARLAVGFGLAATDKTMYRVLGLARPATLVAGRERERAWRLIDQAMEQNEEKAAALGGWRSYGGAASPLVAGRLATRM